MNECIEGSISSNNQGISRSCLLHMVMMERNSIQVPLSLSQNLDRGVSGRKTAGSIVTGGRIRCISTMSWIYCWSTLPTFTPFSLCRNTTDFLEWSCSASKRLPQLEEGWCISRRASRREFHGGSGGRVRNWSRPNPRHAIYSPWLRQDVAPPPENHLQMLH